jgi:hypothetical protein
MAGYLFPYLGIRTGVIQMTHPNKENQVLLRVREGMVIYDWDDKKVGTVKYVQFPGESAEETLFLPGMDKIPHDIQSRLLREGFVMVEGGLLVPDRYILPNQILEVSDREIILNVLKTELIKF